MLRDRSKNFELLDLRREALDKQMELAMAEAVADPKITESLRRMSYLLQQYDYGVERLRINPTEDEFRSSANQFDSILDLLTRQMQDLYGNQEIQFYTNIGDAINLQRTSQALTIGIGGLLLVFGVFLVMSIGRSVSGEFEHAYDLLKQEVGERRKAEDELRRQNEYLAASHETTLALMNRLEISDLLTTVIARAAQLLDTEHGYVYLLNPTKRVMERKVGVGMFRQSLDVLMNWGEGLVGRVWETGAPLVINNYAAWPARTHVPGIREDIIHAVVGMPLHSGQEVVGVIGLAYTTESGRTFGDSEVELLNGFAQLASIALDNAQLFSQAEQRTLQIEALYRADQELYRHLELTDVLQTLVDVAVGILKADKSVSADVERSRNAPRAACVARIPAGDTGAYVVHARSGTDRVRSHHGGAGYD